MNEENLKRIVAHNLSRYRKARNLTQIQLAEQLNYSDKSISKWERAEGLPDLVVLTTIAELFGISLNDLVTERKRLAKPKHRISRLLRAMIMFTSVWFLATVAFVLMGIFFAEEERAYLAFIVAIPVSFAVLAILSLFWGRKIHTFITVSICGWTIPLALLLVIQYEKLWLLFLIVIPLQIIAILIYFLKTRKPLG